MPNFIERVGHGLKQFAEGFSGKFNDLPGAQESKPIISHGQSADDLARVPFKPKLPTADGLDPIYPDMPSEGFGVVGTRKFAGYFGEEYNAKLQGQAGVQAFDAMFRSDPAVHRAVMSSINKLKGGKFYIKPPDKSPEAKLRAEFLNYALFKAPKKVLNDVLNDIFSYLIYGFSVIEPAFRQENNKRWGYCWVVDTYGWRSPKTIWQWFIRDEELTAVRQMSWGDDLKFTYIPGKAYCGIIINGKKEKIAWNELIVFTHFRTGDNLEGISPERPMYGASLRKDKRHRIDIIGAENNARGIRVNEVDENIIGSPIDAKLQKLNEKATLANVPLIKIIKDKMKFSFFQTNYQAAEVQKGIQMENNEIAKSMSSEASETGLNGMGAKSMNQNKDQNQAENIKPEAEYVCQKLQALVEYLEKQNFGEQADYCSVDVEGIDSKPDFQDAQKLQIVNNIIKDPGTPPEMVSYVCEHFDIPLIGKELEDVPEGTSADDAAAAEAAKEEALKGGTGGGGQPKNFQERITFSELLEFNAKRELTKWEKKVNFAEVNRDFNLLNKEYETEIQKSIKEFIIPRYKQALKSALDTSGNKHAAALNVDLSKKVKVKEIIKGLITKALITGYGQAVKEVKGKKALSKQLAEKKLPQGTYSWISTQADFVTDSLYTGLKKAADTSAFNDIDNEAGNDEIVFNAGESAEKYIDDLKNIASGIVINKAVNEGRYTGFEEFEDDIAGYQISAILDEDTCDYCAAMDGQTFKTDDPDAADSPPYHSNCRCIIVPILKTEEAPEWTGITPNSDYMEENGLTLDDVMSDKKLHELAGVR